VAPASPKWAGGISPIGTGAFASTGGSGRRVCRRHSFGGSLGEEEFLSKVSLGKNR